MSVYQSISVRHTAQNEQVRPDQVENNAGGYTFALDRWQQLDRFLILGTEGGTYYAKPRKFTQENARCIEDLLKEDGSRVVKTIEDISVSGRAPKNDPALFALAMATSPLLADEQTRQAAWEALPKVARIATHLFTFLEIVKGFRGRGRSYKRALQNWYLDKDPDRLAYQMVKYRQRGGWSHRDVLRLAKPNTGSPGHRALFGWATLTPTRMTDGGSLPSIIQAYEATKGMNPYALAKHIRDCQLTREMVPTEALKHAYVWEALLQNMPMTAMIRSLGVMSATGLLAPLSQAVTLVANRLTDEERLRKARIHPISVLMALRTYASGSGHRGSLTWETTPQIIDALDEAFYLSFGNVEPANKRTLLALDISGSMTWDGLPSGVTPAEGATAMAMVTLKKEPQTHVMGFDDRFRRLALSRNQRLDDAVKTIYKNANISFGGTDCALPMTWAEENKVLLDTFVVYTDNETWAGAIHPYQALIRYREKMGIAAKLIVVGMTSTGFTIADPRDAGMLDVVGFDSATPQLMTEFSKGSI